MADAEDWSCATWEGSRRRQHEQFFALSFAQKLAVIEELDEVARFFEERRRARGLPSGARPASPGAAPARR